MEVVVEAILFHCPENIEKFQIKVTEDKYPIVQKKLEGERNKLINYLHNMKELGEIRSIAKPKNKEIQPILDEVVKSKKIISDTLVKLRTIFQ